jgi:uncharacterized protein (TIGR00661 family)
MKKTPHIIVCPLDWGIGHATRCVPVIRELLNQKARVSIGADHRPLAFLKQEFPELQFIQFPGYKFSYPVNSNMAMKMALQAPAILNGIKKERKFLKKIILEYNIDGVISDNRFGLSSVAIPSVFISHQLSIRVPPYLAFTGSLLNKINRSYIAAFDECWIPDFESEPNLSGELSHLNPLPQNLFFIGPLSRFAYCTTGPQLNNQNEKVHYDILVILSGPEPQRSVLENLIIQQLKGTINTAAVIRGKPENKFNIETNDLIAIFPHLETEKLNHLIRSSKFIISRPGYSTVMDLAVSGAKAIFIPTPGQTEQEYLAHYYLKKKWFFSMSQKNFDLQHAIQEAEFYSGIKLNYDGSALASRISSLLAKA